MRTTLHPVIAQQFVHAFALQVAYNLLRTVDAYGAVCRAVHNPQAGLAQTVRLL